MYSVYHKSDFVCPKINKVLAVECICRFCSFVLKSTKFCYEIYRESQTSSSPKIFHSGLNLSANKSASFLVFDKVSKYKT